MAFDLTAILQALLGTGEPPMKNEYASMGTQEGRRGFTQYMAAEKGGTKGTEGWEMTEWGPVLTQSNYGTPIAADNTTQLAGPDMATSGGGGWRTFQGEDLDSKRKRGISVGGGPSPEGTPPVPRIAEGGIVKDALNLPEGFLTPDQRRRLMAVGVSPIHASRAVLDAIISGSGQYAPYTPAQIQMANTMKALLAIVAAQQPQRQGAA